MSPAWYLILAGALFAINATTVLVHCSTVIALMGIEMMFNAANLALVTLARTNSNADDEITAFLVMVVAVAEAVVGLSTIVSIYRSRPTTSMDGLNLLKN